MRHLLTALVLAVAVTAIPAYAHHSFARYYEEQRSVSIEGEVYEVTLRSPHAWVYVMAVDEDGESHLIAGEWANVNRLERQGVTAKTLKPGDHIVVTGSPGRDPSESKIHLKAITRLSDGWGWVWSGQEP